MSLPAEPTECADRLLKAIPLVMRTIITQMHGKRGPSVTVPQFRLLFFILNHPESSLAHLAEFLALTPPAASRQVDTLVRKKLVIRKTDPHDRRRIVLTISPVGQAVYDQALQHARDYLAQQLVGLGNHQRQTLLQAMDILARTFAPLAGPALSHRSTR